MCTSKRHAGILKEHSQAAVAYNTSNDTYEKKDEMIKNKVRHSTERGALILHLIKSGTGAD